MACGWNELDSDFAFQLRQGGVVVFVHLEGFAADVQGSAASGEHTEQLCLAEFERPLGQTQGLVKLGQR